MKKKVLLTSITTIILCVSIIAGATFALFTDETQFSIAVTSGDVEIEASAAIARVFSAKGTVDDVAKDEYLKDEKGHGYFHELQTTTIGENHYFKNGGYAVLKEQNLVINKITPGDRVDVVIKVENKSDVAISYRYKIIAKESNLAYGMVVSVGDNTTPPIEQLTDDGLIGYEGLATWTSKWYPVIPADIKNDGMGMDIPDFTFSVELPVYAGNEYQTEYNSPTNTFDDKIETVSYTVLVEAVQGNAVTDDESAVTIFPEAIARRAEKGGVVDGKGSIVSSANRVELDNDVTFKGIEFNSDNLNSYDILAAIGNVKPEGLNFTLDEGAVLNVDRENGIGFHVLFGKNHTVNVNKGAAINVTGTNGLGIFFQETDNATIVLEDTGLIKVNGGLFGISFENVGVANIHVPSVEAYEEYKAMTATGGAKTINWYIGDKQINKSMTAPAVGNSQGTGYEGDLFGPGATDFYVVQNTAMSDGAKVTLERTYNTVVFENVVADVDGYLVSSNCDNTIILHDCDFTLEDGEMLIVTVNNATVGQVMIHNVTVNGELLTSATAAQYMQGVNWYEVW